MNKDLDDIKPYDVNKDYTRGDIVKYEDKILIFVIPSGRGLDIDCKYFWSVIKREK